MIAGVPHAPAPALLPAMRFSGFTDFGGSLGNAATQYAMADIGKQLVKLLDAALIERVGPVSLEGNRFQASLGSLPLNLLT